MSTHDYIIDNGTGAAVRSDLNNALNAVATTNSVAGTPATTYAYQIFHDTSANQGLKQRDGSNAISNGLLLYRPLVRDGIYDPNNVALATMKFAGVASAVNELTATNAITGNAPILSATGNDPHINLTLTPKGLASIFVPAGTATNPSISTSTDSNTGIYFPSADTMGFVEGGTGYPVGYRNTPPSGAEKTTAYTLTTADCGKLVTIGTSGSVVVPGGVNSGFNAGDIVYLFNNTSGTVNVTKGSITTLYQSGSNTEQTTITMAARTMAAIQFISSSVAVFFSGAASSSGFNLDYLIIGGGGGGINGGGGGAGGYINSLTGESYGGGGIRPFSISITPSTTQYIVTVGAGGAGGSTGAASAFHTIAAPGGGVGGGGASTNAGGAGGSGGGGYGAGGGNGVANMGYAGGAGGTTGAGGGGGAGAIGSSTSSSVGGAGGAGLSSSITGTSVTRAGGGGGGSSTGNGTGGAGGAGGGGAGSYNNPSAGTANTGGGGGGTWSGSGAAGGSGVVILRYVTADYSGTRTTTGSPSVTTSGIYTILTFNSSGSVTFGV